MGCILKRSFRKKIYILRGNLVRRVRKTVTFTVSMHLNIIVDHFDPNMDVAESLSLKIKGFMVCLFKKLRSA